MFFHASQVPDIKILTPHVSNHGKSLCYLSSKRQNVLVYLSNAIEKYCKEIGFEHHGVYKKWGSYGFSKDGVLELDEYYPNATIDTYQGVSGFIYSVSEPADCKKLEDIPFAFVTENPVNIEHCEFIPDAYEAILKAAKKGEIILKKYEENSEAMLNWIKKTVTSEYEQSQDHPDYRLFLKAKFEKHLYL